MTTYKGHVKGNVTLYANDDASELASVGELDIRAEGASLPVLASVGGWLYIHAEGASLPVLASVGGLDIHAEGASLPVLASVGGWLYIHAEGASLPVLASVGGLDIHAEGASLPVLASVGELDIHAEGASLPVLASVGRDRDIPCGPPRGLFGEQKRYLMPMRTQAGEPVVRIGCFRGTIDEAVAAIRKKYGPDSDYEAGVRRMMEEVK
jgi:hypothetical protein